MTIASEITRLQNDKAAICTAIENKGVTVGNVTLDDYASCIDAIEQGGGGGGPNVRLLVVAGGGPGSLAGDWRQGPSGGGAGGAMRCDNYPVTQGNYTVTVYNNCAAYGSLGCNASFGTITMYGGGGGGYGWCGSNGGSGGGGAGCSSNGGYDGGTSCNQLYGSNGGRGCGSMGGGGGGAGGCGSNGYGNCNSCLFAAGNGGKGIYSDIDGTGRWYAGGGGGAGGTYYVAQCYGTEGCGATRCGGGGGAIGGSWVSNGKPGVVIVSYKTDGSCGINCATGGCKYTCGDYTIHCFRTSGTFTIVS